MPQKKSSTPLLPIIIILTVIIGGLFFLFKPRPDTPVTPAVPPQENTVESPDATELPPASPPLTDDSLTKPAPDEQEPLLRLAPMDAALTNPCMEATQRLDQFFAYLDEQEYIQRYQFPHDSKEMISNLINTLLKSPPPRNGKTFNGVDVINNSVHIYRVLGVQNLSLLLKIIDNEGDILEETCGNFNEWTNISRQCLNHPYPVRPSLENLYEYASFFLATSGGKAYLARRQNNLRLLAHYYSILIIHQAEQQGVNKYNINLASLLPHFIGEMEESEELAEKNSYLSSLYDIRKELTNVTIH